MKRESLTARGSELKEKLGELDLENRMIEEEIKRDNKSKEELTVQNDLLRLEVRRLRDLLSAKADAVFSLENRRQQLELSMAERKEEISVHREVLRAELRAALEEKHRVTMELRNREANVERLKARFNIANSSKAGEEQHSQAYYVILAAQKREELQRKGDELDHNVRICEKEIRALQTTLDHLNARNKAFRASFQKVELEGDDMQIMEQLEQRMKLGKEALFRKKKELQRLVTDVEEDVRRIEEVQNQNMRATKQREHLESAKAQIEEEILTQQAQLGELDDRLDKMITKHRTKTAAALQISPDMLSGGTLEEKTVRAEVLKDVAQNVLYTLGQLANEFPEITDNLTELLRQADLQLPAKPPSRQGGPRQFAAAPASNVGGNQDNASSLRGQPLQSQRGGMAVQPRTFDVDF